MEKRKARQRGQVRWDRVFVLEDGKIRQTFERGQINAEDIREALHDENDR